MLDFFFTDDWNDKIATLFNIDGIMVSITLCSIVFSFMAKIV